MLNGLDLFSGIGGLSIALKGRIRTIAYCENERYAQGVLLSRMQEGCIDAAPIWDDVRSLTVSCLDWTPDIITAGFPCQDISVAGHGKGLAGERSGLFYEIIRLLKETNAPWVFLENVPAIRTRGLKEVITALTDLGYDCRWTRVSAAEVGACHRRERWFLLAHASGERLERQRQEPSGASQKLQDTGDSCWWASEPSVGRVVNGLPCRSHRLKALGNAVVPLQARVAFERLIGLEE